MADYDFTYGGKIDKETRGFNALRGSVLTNVFAGGAWKNILIGPDGKRVDAPIAANKVGFGVLMDKVKITILDKKENTVLQGAYYRRNDADDKGAVIIFMSGSGGPLCEFALPVLQGYLISARSTRAKIRGVLAVDYRGFGLSRKAQNCDVGSYSPSPGYKPGSKSTYTDARAMIAFAAADKNDGGLGIPANQIVLHGYSLGSGPATQMSAEGQPHGGLILHGPMKSVFFAAFKELTPSTRGKSGKVKIAAASILTLGVWPGIAFAGGLISRGNVGFSNIDKMKDVSAPVLITTGPNDKMWDGAKALRDKLKKHKKTEFFAVHDGDHFNGGAIFDTNASKYKSGKYSSFVARTQLNAFLDHVLNAGKNN